MAEVVPDDILEKILVRLDVKDIIECKRVCKSWYSIISSSYFVKSHLKHNNNTTTRRTRIVIQDEDQKKDLVGCCNGLVCILDTSDYKLRLLNPCTRELRTLKNQSDFPVDKDRMPYLYGFGYDPSSDDYKVILGKWNYKEKYSRFYVSSLKSNSWTVVGDVKFAHNGGSGILCNGALYWRICDQNHNPVILSFHLSTEEFKEIPPPADDRFKFTWQTRRGFIEGCLCIFDRFECNSPVWVLKNYNDKQSWILMAPFLQWDEVMRILYKT